MPPRTKATKAKDSTAKAVKEKKRPTLDDVVDQLISLQDFGITQDSSLLQMCHGDMKCNPAKVSHAFAHPIGIDEAGRGCLAGPVVAAAVILPTSPLDDKERLNTPQAIHQVIKSHLAITPHLENLGLAGLADSKKLTEAQRDTLAPLIRQHALAWGLGVVWPSTIDNINILQATFLAMARAVNNIRMQGSLILIDGNKTIPAHAFAASQAFRRSPEGTHFQGLVDNSTVQQHTIIGGDDIVPAISAASILAKTYRDKLMVAFDKRYPLYGFAKHKGYGTKDHLVALADHGPCPQHRLTFRGVVLQNSPQKTDNSNIQKSATTPLRLC